MRTMWDLYECLYWDHIYINLNCLRRSFKSKNNLKSSYKQNFDFLKTSLKY